VDGSALNFRDDYQYVHRERRGYRRMINKGTGNSMLKKAKLVVSVVRIYWEKPEESTPG
jgi:hypothetical protein